MIEHCFERPCTARGCDSMATRDGFALIELVVALTISAFVLLAARTILVELADDADRIAAAAAHTDRVANGERELRSLLGQVEASSSPGSTFSGDARTVRFNTWCDVPAGWLERCDVTLTLRPGVVGLDLIAQIPGIGAIPVRTGVPAGSLLYLGSAQNGGTWLSAWNSRVTTPLALGVVLDRDTLILRIGQRG